jgi:pyruvate dehydrogenase E1 component alpha subunit
MQRDPVDIARKTLIDWGVLDAPGADALEAEVKAEVAEAFAWAAEQPLCKPEDGLLHVFAEGAVLPRQIA